MQTTKLDLQSKLPLTCSRIGTCCHGNQVLVNPFELYQIAKEKKISAKEFRDKYCDLGGVRLLFNGNKDSRGKQACSQYTDGFGCSVHEGRPLACRLFPIGRQVQNNEVHYIHQGTKFPCLDGCSEVLNLPYLSLGEYLNGQETSQFENAQDEYLEVMQNLADMAFELLLDSGLAESGDKKTLSQWKVMSNETPELLIKRIGEEWYDYLTIPNIIDDSNEISFTQKHNELLQTKIQEKFGAIQKLEEFHQASVLVMALTIQLARSVGANPLDLTMHWIEVAKKHGAKD
jgi:Fe-S-cluster containining protein